MGCQVTNVDFLLKEFDGLLNISKVHGLNVVNNWQESLHGLHLIIGFGFELDECPLWQLEASGHTCVDGRLIGQRGSSSLDKRRHEAQFNVVLLQVSILVNFWNTTTCSK